MARRIISQHSLSSPLKRGRRAALMLVEGALLSILSVFTFMILGYFDGLFPVYSSSSSAASSSSKAMTSLIVESGAGESDGLNGLLSYSERAEAYIKNATYTSLKANNKETSSLIYAGAKTLDGNIDKAYYYLVSYKEEKEETFDDLSFRGRENYLSYFSDDAIFASNEGYPLLEVSNAEALDQYYRDGVYEKGLKLSQAIEKDYKKLCSEIVADFQSHSIPYKEEYAKYEIARDDIYRFKIVEAFLCHLFVCFVYFFALTFLVKEGQTYGRRILKAPLISSDGTLLPWWKKLLLSLTVFVESSLIPSFLPLAYYGAGAVELFLSPCIGPFSLLWVSLLSLCLSLLSYCCCFFLKERKSLVEFIFKAKTVDGRED